MNYIRNIILFVGLFVLVGCSGVYEPGDFYKGDGFEAVVVTVDEANQPTMVMSLNELSSLNADSAIRWANSLGDDWRLPDKNEVAKIERVRSLINSTLERRGLPPVLVGFTYYWSSTPCSESHTYACGPDGVGCYYSENAGSSYRARAVKTITNAN